MLNFKKAFTSPFTGENWKSSLAFIVGMNFTYIILLKNTKAIFPGMFYAVIALVVSFLITGFNFSFLHNEINNDANLMPDWKNNMGKFFKQGFIGSLGVYLYSFFPFVIISPIFILIPILVMFAHHAKFAYTFTEWYLFYIPLYILMFLAFVILGAFSVLYAVNFKFSDLGFVKVFKLIENNSKLFLVICCTNLGILALMLLMLFLNYKRSLFATDIIFQHKEHYIMLARANALVYIAFEFITGFIMMLYALISLNLTGQAYKIGNSKDSKQIQ